MSPFDRAFKGTLDMTVEGRNAKMAKTKSKQRTKDLESEDADKRRNAQAAVGKLSGKRK